MNRWRRSDVEPMDLFIDRDSVIWQVLGIADEPTVKLVALTPLPSDYEGRNDMRTYVISSPLFAEQFTKLERRRP